MGAGRPGTPALRHIPGGSLPMFRGSVIFFGFPKRIEVYIFSGHDLNFENGQLMELKILLMGKQSCGTTRHMGPVVCNL